MQYDLKVGPCKNVNERKRSLKIGTQIFRLVSMFVGGILISRVVLYLNTQSIKGIAPFGIAYLLAVIIRNDEKNIISAALGIEVGYLTISFNISDSYINLIPIIFLVVYSLIVKGLNKQVKDFIMYGIIFLGYLNYEIFINQYDIGIGITMAAINTVIVIPIFCIIKYGISSLEEFNTSYFFASEEIISIGIIICLMVSGIGNINIFNIGIKNILAYSIIMIIAFVGGATYGSVMGISMGIIIGISSGNMIESIAFFSAAGLIVGIFKDTGKIFSFLSYLIMYLSLALYSKRLGLEPLLEVCLAGVIFFVIPKSVRDLIGTEINSDSKKEKFNELGLNEFKDDFTEKIRRLQRVLKNLSNTLGQISDNDNLMYKNKSAALIENLADRVCPKCSKCSKCWNRDFNQTYNAFEILIKSYENGKVVFPHELEKICLYKFDLIKDVEKIVNNLNNKQVLKDRLGEERVLLANHIDNISYSIGEMLLDFKKDVTLCEDIERTIRRAFNKNYLQTKNIFCYRDENARECIKVTMQSCGGSKYCAKNILPVLNEVMNKKMIIGGDGCRIDPKTGDCSVVFEESPKYKVLSYGAIAVKDGESCSGDTFSFGKSKDGKYVTLISDGMGSGPEASKESKATVDLIESFMEAGFKNDTAINMINSIMSMKFEEDERFSTLDLNSIDLYSGQASFIKIGAVASFIKRGKKVEPIISNMPPFGVVDKVELDEVEETVKNGDIIVTLSDGVLDVNKESLGKYNWLQEYLIDSTKNPKELAAEIIEKAKDLGGGKVKDDMTVVVSKVYSIG